MRLVNRKIEYVTPGWVQAYWDIYISYLETAQDVDVVVVGNTGNIADVTIPESILASSIGRSVTIVLDIGGHITQPHSLFEYHSVIAPSHFAQKAFANILNILHSSQGILELDFLLLLLTNIYLICIPFHPF